MNNINQQLAALLLASTLTACGGSGGIGNTEPVIQLGLGELADTTFSSEKLTLGLDQLSSKGQTSVSVSIVNTADISPYLETVSVSFTSDCVEQGLATINSPIATTTGIALSTYTADGCVGRDTIKASISSGEEAIGSLSIAPADLGALTFVSTSPTIIAPLNISNTTLPTSAEVTFKLVDKTNNPLAEELIHFTVSSTVGDVELLTSSAQTDSDGLVTAIVLAGSQRDNITVRATADSTPSVSTQSQNIVVLTSAPVQHTLSLAAETYNPPCMTIQGEKVPITVRVSDYYNTPAAEGLQVEFYTRHGQIDGACTLIDGECSVNWTTQDPRPDSGIVAIMATLKGEETTPLELNGNSLFDDDNGETWLPLGEAYLDENLNGAYDFGEYYKDTDQNQTYTTQVADKFRGIRCTQTAAENGHCEELADIFENIHIACSNNLSASGITVSGTAVSGDTISLEANQREQLTLTLSDPKGLAPISGTSLEVIVKNSESHIIEVTPTNFEIHNRLVFAPSYQMQITLEGEGDPGQAGTITLSGTNSDGTETAPVIFDIIKR